MSSNPSPPKTPKINPALIKALKALFWASIGTALKLCAEYGLTIGAAGLAGLAHPIPGVVPSGSAAFAVLAAVRYFWVLEHHSAAPVDPPNVHAARAAQLAQSQELLDHLAEQIKNFDEPVTTTTAGPYL